MKKYLEVCFETDDLNPGDMIQGINALKGVETVRQIDAGCDVVSDEELLSRLAQILGERKTAITNLGGMLKDTEGKLEAKSKEHEESAGAAKKNEAQVKKQQEELAALQQEIAGLRTEITGLRKKAESAE